MRSACLRFSQQEEQHFSSSKWRFVYQPRSHIGPFILGGLPNLRKHRPPVHGLIDRRQALSRGVSSADNAGGSSMQMDFPSQACLLRLQPPSYT
ncbi:hypothetical protein VTJ49DRAFT_150 [Mycothermus thermophilus]|uniref:Uncharacterized protein n=1 Tax=Humicola insolens TaxID=85995 RepID=A0ABR3VFW8_HUMIN